MAFTASDVKELREMTGCGMMDCKKALTETDGDKDKAVELLREKGLATAAKKSGRIASEGIVKSHIDGGVGVVVEVNSETDFVAKNADFQDFVADVAKTVAVAAPADVEALKATECNGTTVGDILTERGYKYLICEMGDDYDREKDFYNEGHVNYYGALKFTDYFSEYLLENYDLTDRRNDENCEYWNGHIDKSSDTVAHWEKEAKAEKEEK